MIWRGDCRCDSVIFLFVSAWFAHWKIGIKPTECTTSFTQIISKIKWKRNVCECASQITAENSTVQLGHKSLCVRFVNYISIDWTACMRSFEYASSTRPPPFKHIIEMEFLAYFQQVQFTRKKHLSLRLQFKIWNLWKFYEFVACFELCFNFFWNRLQCANKFLHLLLWPFRKISHLPRTGDVLNILRICSHHNLLACHSEQYLI